MFDPYHKWLGILPKDQPPHHYRLLSLEAFESDLDVIEGAADRQMGFIRQYQSGEHAALAAKLLNEIAMARLCLLKPKSKAEYDAKLQAILKPKEVDQSDGVSFEFDPGLVAESVSVQRVKKAAKAKSHSGPKAKNPSHGLFIASGIGGALIAIVAGTLLFNSRPITKARKPPVSEAVEMAAIPSVTKDEPSRLEVNEAPSAEKPQEVATAMDTVETPMLEEPAETPQPVAPVQIDVSGGTINLLPLIDIKRDTLAGTWEKDGDIVRVMGNVAVSKLVIPADVPAEYKLTIRLDREAGGKANNECLTLRLPLGEFMADVFLDGYGSSISGIDIDHVPIDNLKNVAARRLQAIKPGVIQQLDITVRKNGVKVVNGERTIIDWTGAPKRLWTQSDWMSPPGHIAIGSYYGRFRFEELQLTAIESSAASESMPDSRSDLMSIIDPARDARVKATPPADIISKCVTWKGKKYYISDLPVTFEEAQELASRWQGRLLTISSRDEENFLYKQGNGRYLWTAMWRRPGTKEWHDERDRLVKFTPSWAPGQPNFGDYELLTVLQTSDIPGNRGLHDASVADKWYACIEWGNEYPGKATLSPK